MDINDLKKIFKQATDTNEDVCIELTIPNRKANEFIIILNDNLDYKLNYYTKNYTEDLTLNTCTDFNPQYIVTEAPKVGNTTLYKLERYNGS